MLGAAHTTSSHLVTETSVNDSSPQLSLDWLRSQSQWLLCHSRPPLPHSTRRVMCKSGRPLVLSCSYETGYVHLTQRVKMPCSLQALLSVWSANCPQSFQYVRQLHPLPSGHHCGHAEAAFHPVVQGELTTASQWLLASYAHPLNVHSGCAKSPRSRPCTQPLLASPAPIGALHCACNIACPLGCAGVRAIPAAPQALGAG